MSERERKALRGSGMTDPPIVVVTGLGATTDRRGRRIDWGACCGRFG